MKVETLLQLHHLYYSRSASLGPCVQWIKCLLIGWLMKSEWTSDEVEYYDNMIDALEWINSALKWMDILLQMCTSNTCDP